MQPRSMLAFVAAGAVVLTIAACGEDPPPPFEPGTVETKNPQKAYPAGPYGVGEGSIVAPFSFMGYPAPDKENATLAPIDLSDFYNPHGKDPSYKPASPAEDDRLFPAGSAYAGQPKPTVLLVDTSSSWCNPCKYQAQYVMPGKHTEYKPCGGEFVLYLADGPTPGINATPKNLTTWTKSYKVDYPAFLDPSDKLSPLYMSLGYPDNMIIDATTMTILRSVSGVVFPKTCGAEGLDCEADADCRTCDSDYKFCKDGSKACSTDADCASVTTACGPTAFWQTFEEHLDKGRDGCTVP